VTFGAEPDTDPDVPALRALARGDMGGLRILADRHGPGLLSFLTGLTGDRQLAEEVLQDTWVALWRGAAGFVGGSTVRTWIYGKWGLHLAAVVFEVAQVSWSRQGRPVCWRSRLRGSVRSRTGGGGGGRVRPALRSSL